MKCHFSTPHALWRESFLQQPSYSQLPARRSARRLCSLSVQCLFVCVMCVWCQWHRGTAYRHLYSLWRSSQCVCRCSDRMWPGCQPIVSVIWKLRVLKCVWNCVRLCTTVRHTLWEFTVCRKSVCDQWVTSAWGKVCVVQLIIPQFVMNCLFVSAVSW